MQAKTPGPQVQVQKVNMRFDYREAFEVSRATGFAGVTEDRLASVARGMVLWSVLSPGPSAPGP